MDTVNEKATFQDDDIFNRAAFAKKAMSIIAIHPIERGACSISIDAPWGMGKSTFIHMWMNELSRNCGEQGPSERPVFQCDPNICIYYNAWENDYHENALFPLIYSICGSLCTEKVREKAEKGKKQGKILEVIRKVVSASTGILVNFACAYSTHNQALGTAFGGLASSATESVMKCFDNTDVEGLGNQFTSDNLVRQEFRDALSELTEQTGRLYVFIDELDRCIPLFAIRTLECIKHFFNVPNVTFIFATDVSQLAHSIAGVYGQGMNAGGYLSKFFDYQLHLPLPNIYDLIKYAYPRVSIDSEYYGLLNEVVNSIGLTPREMPLIIKQAVALWEANNMGRAFFASYIIPYFTLFFGMKYRLPDIYRDFFDGLSGWQDRINKSTYPNAYEMLDYTFNNLQVDKAHESEILKWEETFDSALKSRRPKGSIEYNLPHLFAFFSRETDSKLRTLREVLLSSFELLDEYRMPKSSVTGTYESLL